ncbi:hypothetical protein P692DRAFT_20836147 [Suillus brevipes Sb2]|nr:hypothetical protein P692DRAFT_20836147 [Suillus brevipes Sb2]
MASSLDVSTPVYPLYISGVIVDSSNLKKNVESVDVRISLTSPTPIKSGAGKVLRQTFSPPMKLSLGDTFALHVRYKRWYGLGREDKDIIFEPEDMFRVCGTRERQGEHNNHCALVLIAHGFNTTCTEYNKAEQLVSSSDETLELRPTTDEIFRKCPQFRILVIGKTGVGKSSLINHAFGVQNATTSHDRPGEASIDHEFISPQNDRFVLHDSKGFEPGSEDNLKTVRDFIDQRRANPDLKDQLHAVWLCFEIPRAGGRLLETGVEQFLTSRRKGELGNIPIVVVFTKYDTLLDRMERTLDKSSLKGLSKEAIQERTKKIAQDKLQDVCIAPLEKFAGSDIPHVTISTNGNHEETLALLIQTTEGLVCKHIGIDALRVDPGLKIKASIDRHLCLSEYWKALSSSVPFKNRSMWDCLHVLHTDIINVWNFQDPHGYLCSPEFRTLMANMLDELDVGPIADASKNFAFGLSIVGTIGTILSTMGPAAPIVVPIVASVVIAKWVHEVYQRSRAALQRLMKYIIDLTLVLQTLALVAGNQELSRKAIKLAVKSYHDSPMSRDVHNRVQEYDRQLTFLERADRDSLDQLVKLLQSYKISAEEMTVLRGSLPAVDLLSDEPWDTVEKS